MCGVALGHGEPVVEREELGVFHEKCWEELTDRSGFSAIEARVPEVEARLRELDRKGGDPPRFGWPLDTSEILGWFERTGVPLVLTGRNRSLLSPLLNDREFERLRFIDPSSEVDAEFGLDFFESPEAANQDVAYISDERDRDGIHWMFSEPEHRGDRSHWLAAKAYENVVLYWWPQRETHGCAMASHRRRAERPSRSRRL